MKKTGAAGLESRIRNRGRFLTALISMGLLLSVQTGLAYHEASHIHVGDEDADCSLCVLGAHFAAEPVEVPSVQFADSAVGLFRDKPEDPVPSINRSSTARGPPAISV